MAKQYIAVDLGASKILFGIVDEAGKVIYKKKIPTASKRGFTEVILDICQHIRPLVTMIEESSNILGGVALATPGPLSYPDAVVYDSPNLLWRKVPLKSIIQNELKMEVVIEKDTNMAVLGEYYFDNDHRATNMLYLTISTGIGGGIIINGKLFRGSNGGAGEFGHMIIDNNGPVCNCGKTGCWEAIAAGAAIENEINRLALGNGRGVAGLIEEVKNRNKDALAFVNRMINYWSIGIGNAINILNPDVVVLGGGVTWGWQDLIEMPIFEETNRQIFSLQRERIRLKISSLRDENVLLGGWVVLTSKEY